MQLLGDESSVHVDTFVATTSWSTSPWVHTRFMENPGLDRDNATRFCQGDGTRAIAAFQFTLTLLFASKPTSLHFNSLLVPTFRPRSEIQPISLRPLRISTNRNTLSALKLLFSQSGVGTKICSRESSFCLCLA